MAHDIYETNPEVAARLREEYAKMKTPDNIAATGAVIRLGREILSNRGQLKVEDMLPVTHAYVRSPSCNGFSSIIHIRGVNAETPDVGERTGGLIFNEYSLFKEEALSNRVHQFPRDPRYLSEPFALVRQASEMQGLARRLQTGACVDEGEYQVIVRELRRKFGRR